MTKLPPQTEGRQTLFHRLFNKPSPSEESAPSTPPSRPPLQEKASALRKLWDAWQAQESSTPTSTAWPQALLDSLEADKAMELFQEVLPALEAEARARLGQMQQDSPLKLDAFPFVQLTHDKMFALLFIFPPFGGDALTMEQARAALVKEKVSFGLDAALVERAVGQRLYFQLLPVARGTPAVDGEDGYIIDLVPRESVIRIQETTDGFADFRNLNLIKTVQPGDALCEIVPPTQSLAGTNVQGGICRAHVGKRARVPKGRNTQLDADGRRLTAAVGGHVLYKNDRFSVDEVLYLPGDVDNSVGNLDFIGDIVINGDVREGFHVKAQGDITVRGMVEGAAIEAKGDITLLSGMNGNGVGVLNAKGNLKCRYLENCTVHVDGCIQVETIVGCTLFCADTVSVLNSRGAIIGGTLTVSKCVQAKVIGSKGHHLTTIVLGNDPALAARIQEATPKLEAARQVLATVRKNIAYLKANPPENEARRALLNQLLEQEELYAKEEKQLAEVVNAKDPETQQLKECRVKSPTIYPRTKITIGKTTTIIETVSTMCNVYLSSEGEIVIGTL